LFFFAVFRAIELLLFVTTLLMTPSSDTPSIDCFLADVMLMYFSAAAKICCYFCFDISAATATLRHCRHFTPSSPSFRFRLFAADDAIFLLMPMRI